MGFEATKRMRVNSGDVCDDYDVVKREMVDLRRHGVSPGNDRKPCHVYDLACDKGRQGEIRRRA